MSWATGVQLISTQALRLQGKGVFDLGLKSLWKGPPPEEGVELYKHVMGLLVQWDARRLRALAALEEYGKRDPAPARRVPPAAAASTSGAGEASPRDTADAGEAPAPAQARRGAASKQRAVAPPTVSPEERLQAHDQAQQQVNATYDGHAIVDISRQHLEAIGLTLG